MIICVYFDPYPQKYLMKGCFGFYDSVFDVFLGMGGMFYFEDWNQFEACYFDKYQDSDKPNGFRSLGEFREAYIRYYDRKQNKLITRLRRYIKNKFMKKMHK